MCSDTKQKAITKIPHNLPLSVSVKFSELLLIAACAGGEQHVAEDIFPPQPRQAAQDRRIS